MIDRFKKYKFNLIQTIFQVFKFANLQFQINNNNRYDFEIVTSTVKKNSYANITLHQSLTQKCSFASFSWCTCSNSRL